MEKLQKGPPPWLAPILSVIAIFLTVLWAYIQMRHWKDPDSDYLALGINIVITLSLWAVLLYLMWKHAGSSMAAPHRTMPERFLLMQTCYRWNRVLTEYRRLDYDDKESSRFPFNHASWPHFNERWSYTHARLYSLYDRVIELSVEAKMLKVFNWPDWSPYLIPETNQDKIMTFYPSFKTL